MGDARLIALAIAASHAGCFDAGSYACDEPGECRYAGVQGRCELNGFCSYPSTDCPSGRLWGPYAGDGLAGDCVDVQAGDGGSDPACERWPAGWRRRLPLRYNLDQSFTASPGFPALVVLDPSRIDYAAAAAGGRDVHFTDGDGNPLPRDIDTWVANGTSHVWVRLPWLGPESGLVYLYYDRDDGDEADDPAVFDADFHAVWHLGGDRSDASGGGHDLVDDSTLPTEGVAGRASDFVIDDDVGQRITAPLGDAFAGTATVTAWIRDAPDPGGFAGGTVFSVGDGALGLEGLAGFVGRDEDAGALCFGRDFGMVARWCTPEDTLAGSGWHHVAWVSEPSSATLFVDGTQRTTALGGVELEAPVDVAGLPLSLGNDVNDARPLAGAIDEFRIATTRRDAEWIRAEALSGTDALFEYGDEQTCP